MSMRIYYPAFQVVRRNPWVAMDPFQTTFCGFPVARNPLHEVESAVLRAVIDQLAERKTQNKEYTKEPLTFKLDLSGFEPENIKLKTVGQKLIVDAETEESNEKEGCQSYSVRKYHRTITLPDDVKPDDVTSLLTKEGVLRITAPVTSLPSPQEEKEVAITMEDEPPVEISKDDDTSYVNEKAEEQQA